MRTISGIHKAEVIATDTFKDTGKITIRLLGVMSKDATEEAEVLTPFGGLPNMGMQAVPPIGSIGYVSFDRESELSPVWIGAVLRYFGKEEKEESWMNPVEAGDASDFIIKTQYTKPGDVDITKKTNKIENILYMNENEFTIAKVQQLDDKYEYDKKPYDMEEKPYNILKLTNYDIKLSFKFKDNTKKNSLFINEEKVEMSFDTEAGDMGVTVTEDTVQLSAGSNTITINKEGTVIVSCNKVELAGNGSTAALYEGFRDFVNNSFNSHTHGTPAGPSSPPTARYTSTNSAKSSKVKLA